jgi:homoserine dehydrogenase
MTGLQNGEAFSEVVREAERQGFTEPDPRDDLGGVGKGNRCVVCVGGRM